MQTPRLLFRASLLSVLAGACSADAVTSGANPSGGDASTSDDDGSSPEDAATHDGSAPKDGSVPKLDAGGDTGTPGSTPPAGSQPCGSGIISSASAKAVCIADKTSPWGTGIPHECEAISFVGGEWKAFCTKEEVYLSVRFDGPKSTENCNATGPDGKPFVIARPVSIYALFGNQASVNHGGSINVLPIHTPGTVSGYALLPNEDPNGVAHVTVTATFADCNFASPKPPAPPVAVGGADLSWNRP